MMQGMDVPEVEAVVPEAGEAEDMEAADMVAEEVVEDTAVTGAMAAVEEVMVVTGATVVEETEAMAVVVDTGAAVAAGITIKGLREDPTQMTTMTKSP